MSRCVHGGHRSLIAAAAAAVLSVMMIVGSSGAFGASASGAGTAAAARPPAAKPTPVTTTTTPAPGTCADGAQPVSFGGQWYCPGYVIGVQKTTYGIGTRVVLGGVTVVQLSGTKATVEGGPSCMPSTTICGQTIPTVPVYFSTSTGVPHYGDVIDAYGVTGSGFLTATGYVFVRHCDPDLGC